MQVPPPKLGVFHRIKTVPSYLYERFCRILRYITIGRIFCCVFWCTWCPQVVKAFWTRVRLPFINFLKCSCVIPRSWCSSSYVGNRVVKLNMKEGCFPKFPSNHISNNKYSLFLCICHNLAEQFLMSSMNRYFLAIGVVQLIPGLSVVNPVSTWFPIIVFFAISMLFSLLDDARRCINDKRLNNRVVTVLKPNGKEKRKRSKNIKVGEIVKIHQDEEIPCDCVVIYSSGKDGAAFITTANLDGETDLKARPTPKPIYEYITKLNNPDYDPRRDEAEVDNEGGGEVQVERLEGDPDLGGVGEEDEEEETTDGEKSSSSSDDEAEVIMDENEEKEEEGEYPVVAVEDEKKEKESLSSEEEKVTSDSESENNEEEESEEIADLGPVEDSVRVKEQEEEEVKEETREVTLISQDDEDEMEEGGEELELEDDEEENKVRDELFDDDKDLMNEDEIDGEMKKRKKKKKKKKKKGKKRVYWPFVKRLEAKIVCPKPNNRIYEFNSTMKFAKKRGKSKGIPDVSISGDQLVLQSCMLKNTEWVLGICVYTGNETKCGMNKGAVPSKKAQSDHFMDKMCLMVFAFQMLVLVVILGVFGDLYYEFDRAEKTWYLRMYDYPDTQYAAKWIMYVMQPFVLPIRFWMLTTLMVPLSLKGTLDFMKFLYSLLIMWDRDMYDERTHACANARNSGIIEDLGQIEYILTDKTGTLTQNEMVFQRCSIKSTSWGTSKEAAHLNTRLKALLAEEREDELLYFKALVLCHTVSREMIEGVMEYISVSPDEVALVEAAAEVGMVLSHTADDCYHIKYNGKTEVWMILRVLKFNSDRKRMSVLCQNYETKEMVLWSKGADDMMLLRVRKDGKYKEVVEATEKHLKEYSELGLRTLVVACKVISEEEYKVMKENLYFADTVLGDERKAAVDAVYDEIETDMLLVGTTAIEDKLQDEVQKTIWMLREAGIAVWMLTGDKFETAKQIGYSCNLVSLGQVLHEIRGKTIDEIKDVISRANAYQSENRREKYSIIIEGSTLSAAFQHAASTFKKLCFGAETVVCARVTPSQKADIVRVVKKNGKMTLAIGDGGNDVPMIQAAHVGVGITGKEGLQASRAADFSFGQFRFLIPLVFVHGHYSLLRSGLAIQYSFYKGIVLSWIQVFYSVLARLSGISPYNDLALLAYNTPVTLYVVVLVFDRFIDKTFLKNRPKLYNFSKGRATYNFQSFLQWFFIGLLHGTIVVFVVTISYSDNVTPNLSSSPDIHYFGVVLYTTLLLVVVFTYLVFSWSHSCCSCSCVWILVGIYFVIMLIYNVAFYVLSLPIIGDVVGLLFADDYEFFFEFFQQAYDPTQYFSVLFGVTVSVLPVLIYRYLKMKISPNVVEDFHEMERKFRKYRDAKRNKGEEGLILREERLQAIGGGYVKEPEEEFEEEEEEEQVKLEKKEKKEKPDELEIKDSEDILDIDKPLNSLKDFRAETPTVTEEVDTEMEREKSEEGEEDREDEIDVKKSEEELEIRED